MDAPIRVLIVDDHEVVRRGLESIISACDDLLVVGIASSGEEAIVLADSVDADIVLLDLKMPGMHGLEVLPLLLKDGAVRLKVIVLTVHDDEEIVLSAVKSGASGYVLKRRLSRRADPGDPLRRRRWNPLRRGRRQGFPEQ